MINTSVSILVSMAIIASCLITYVEATELNTESFCDSDEYDSISGYQGSEIREVHEVDVDNNGVMELLVLRQGNNFAEFHLYFLKNCGFELVVDEEGNNIRFLSYSSSMSCQPIGCLQRVFCSDIHNNRYLISVTGRHTLTQEQALAWMHGRLPDDQVTSKVTRTQYSLIEGKLKITDTQSWPGVEQNISKLTAIDKDSHGFEHSSCL